MQSIQADLFLQTVTSIIDLREAIQLRMISDDYESYENDAISKFIEESPEFEADCRRIGFAATAAGFNRARQAINSDSRLFMRNRLNELLNILLDEAASFELLVQNAGTKPYAPGEAFGIEVAAKFPSLIEDIDSAARCISLDLGTSAVFHLMRVMELSIQRLGKIVKIKIDTKESTWYAISQHVEVALKNLPAKTARQKYRKAQIAIAVAHLNAVRIAWRNAVMHPKATYTTDEARVIFANVGLFLQSTTKI